MKYSIRGNLQTLDGSLIVLTLNDFNLWRLITNTVMAEDGLQYFNFEAWVNTVEDKDNLFNRLKPFVDQYGEVIDWHECSHDEINPQPCVISEEYRR